MKFKIPKNPLPGRMRFVFALLAIAATLYYLTVSIIYWGRLDKFGCLVVATGSLSFVCCIAYDKFTRILGKIPKGALFASKVVAVALCGSFLVIGWGIVSRMTGDGEPGADVVLVLGCQVKGAIPSQQMVNRVNVAEKYLKENENTKVIVTGGQGPGEDMTEAEAMKMLLLRNGIDETRILIEDKAANTMENFKFSDDRFDLADKRVLVVTTDYHMYRALSLARKFDYKNVGSLPSRSLAVAMPLHILREYAAVVYYTLLGRI